MADCRTEKIKFWYIVFRTRTDLVIATSLASGGEMLRYATAL